MDTPPPPWIDAPRVRLDGHLRPAERFRQLPAESIARGRELAAEFRRLIPKKALRLARPIHLRTAGRWRAECRALAELLDVTPDELLLANVGYDLTLSGLGCSTTAVATADGPVLARNMDWWPEEPLARCSLLTETVHADHTVWNAGWPGGIGVVSGMSSRGFGLALNAVDAPDAPDWLGVPVLLFLRTVLEDAADYADARRRIERRRLFCGAIVTLVGRTNGERAVIERTARRHATRTATRGEPLVATNHYVTLDPAKDDDPADRFIAESIGRTCGRYDALRELLAGCGPAETASDARLLFALTDPDVRQQITAQHVVLRPATGGCTLAVPRRLVGAEVDEERVLVGQGIEE